MRVLVTGTAGFIGFHLARKLIADGHEVAGLDGFTTYYDVALKEARHAVLKRHNGFSEHRFMLEDAEALGRLYEAFNPEVVVHLAAQAGVRYSLENPRAYIEANVVGTFNLLELARTHAPQHLLLASTSSVYGANLDMPFVERTRTDHPLTLYAATKKATEGMAHAYSHLWKIPVTAFRFFTVYGPWGRPDMALFKFVEGISQGKPIDIYNNGGMKRDFTYVEDLVEGIVRLIACAPSLEADPIEGDSLSPVAPHRVVNIGRGEPVELMEFIEQIEEALGKTAIRNYMPMQAGDVPQTFANADLLFRLTGYRPATSTREGVRAFVEWYRQHHSS